MPTQAQIQAMQVRSKAGNEFIPLTAFKRAMPPGMMQQLRSGGGIQDMMKAMMGGGQMGDAEMAEMQRGSSHVKATSRARFNVLLI